MLQLTPGQHVHFIGIAGAGLSAIARVLLDKGLIISGSDLNQTDLTHQLQADGATIYRGHDAAYINGADLVIASSAIPSDHIEIATATAHNIPVYKRKDIMAAVMAGHDNIAIAGTHGKTTTTSMVVHILQQAGNSPSFIVGGKMGNTGKNAGIGHGKAFVIEADEYDNMFHGLRPNLAVVTNIEHDHPDFFKTPEQLLDSHTQFIGLLPSDGILVGCIDDPITARFMDDRIATNLPAISYGIHNAHANWQAVDIHQVADKTVYTVLRNGEQLGEVALSVPGQHNVLNSLAALIVADQQGVTFDTAATALTSFRNTGRRFDIRGERGNVILVDDYAHHPTEIKATIQAAKDRYPDRTIWAVWQPHTYSRIQQFMADFATAFDNAHHVMVTPIFAAREKPVDGISGASVAANIQHDSVYHAPSLDEAVDLLRDHIQAPAIVLILSAGDANRIADDYLNTTEQA
jgi:UDP-N-acetylmuramate--alanine ligase